MTIPAREVDSGTRDVLERFLDMSMWLERHGPEIKV